METANIFPVFSQLYGDEPLASERPARKANEAGLFVVSVQAISESDEPEETQDAPLKVTGDLATDTPVALQCIAFLAEFFNCLEPGDLRRIADELRVRP